MQRLGGAVILMKNDNVTYLVGDKELIIKPIEPYSDIVCEFLDDLSKRLRQDILAKRYPDIMSLAFWCRKSNLTKLKNDFIDGKVRMGRGLIFHTAPSNVPINFAFSYFFGLLSGNSNIVRVPTKDFEQIDIICNIIKALIEKKEYYQIKNMTNFVTYPKESEATSYFSSICDGRVIWGGDATINTIRKSQIKERTIEIVFADRYSMCIINSEEILTLNDKMLKDLAEKFYNDTYLMDQNACSTPHLLLWYGNNKNEKQQAKKVFWDSVFEIARKYDLAPIKAIDKYTMLCNISIDMSNDIQEIKKYDNLIYVVNLKNLRGDITKLRGKFGLFYEHHIEDLNCISNYINKKVQTLTYFGMNKTEISKFVIENNLQGIDRIVPIGSSLDMNIIWDGYDIIGNLSRVIEVR